MLHLSLLAHHRKWAPFLSRLHMVVVDEVHTYRGVMGSHVAQIFRRFHRICYRYGASPTFIFSSATVANPAQLARQLTGLRVETINESGAPRGQRQLVFLNPVLGPARASIHLLKAALRNGLRTIVYTQSRKLTELIAMWAGSESGTFADRISAYRAGLLPQERRDIEARLASGDLLAVITTSALELGIDIGDLDLCLLVGYPGSVISTWQRGGRVGRSGQDSALVLIAGEDALDQYFMRNPQDFINRKPESAVVNPFNKQIMAQHLVCAIGISIFGVAVIGFRLSRHKLTNPSAKLMIIGRFVKPIPVLFTSTKETPLWLITSIFTGERSPLPGPAWIIIPGSEGIN
jgi:DEAD/DEAH box helicase domain-containing protein